MHCVIAQFYINVGLFQWCTHKGLTLCICPCLIQRYGRLPVTLLFNMLIKMKALHCFVQGFVAEDVLVLITVLLRAEVSFRFHRLTTLRADGTTARDDLHTPARQHTHLGT
jgi:hypothetical protein